MNKIFYIFGKSCSGKDTIYKRLLSEYGGRLKKVVPYTTRPIRSGEEEGDEYHFVTENEFYELLNNGLIIEHRSYDTIHGLWRYFTVSDEQLKVKEDLLMIGVLSSYISTRDYFGADRVIPIFVDLDDGVRLKRAVEREMTQSEPKYAELCRRFLADTEDFSEDKIQAAGIKSTFINGDLSECIREISQYIDEERKH